MKVACGDLLRTECNEMASRIEIFLKLLCAENGVKMQTSHREFFSRLLMRGRPSGRTRGQRTVRLDKERETETTEWQASSQNYQQADLAGGKQS